MNESVWLRDIGDEMWVVAMRAIMLFIGLSVLGLAVYAAYLNGALPSTLLAISYGGVAAVIGIYLRDFRGCPGAVAVLLSALCGGCLGGVAVLTVDAWRTVL